MGTKLAKGRRMAVDASRAIRKLGRIDTGGKIIGERAVREMGTIFVDTIEVFSPRDTNRWVRSWQDAGNKAGLPPRTLLPVKRSGRRDEWIEALIGQAQYWEKEARYFAGLLRLAEARDRDAMPRRDGKPRRRATATESYRRYTREQRRAERKAAKSWETVREAVGSESFLLFDKGGFAKGRTPRAGKTGRYRSSIRTRVYGGEGSMTTVGDFSALTLKSLEPHAAIVARSARHGRPVEFALDTVRMVGATRLRDSFVESVRAVSGLGGGRAVAGIGGTVGSGALGGVGRVA